MRSLKKLELTCFTLKKKIGWSVCPLNTLLFDFILISLKSVLGTQKFFFNCDNQFYYWIILHTFNKCSYWIRYLSTSIVLTFPYHNRLWFYWTQIFYGPIFLVIDFKGRDSLTAILLLWEVPNHRILETLTSTDKLLGHMCSMGKMFKICKSQTYLAGHVT